MAFDTKTICVSIDNEKYFSKSIVMQAEPRVKASIVTASNITMDFTKS